MDCGIDLNISSVGLLFSASLRIVRQVTMPSVVPTIASDVLHLTPKKIPVLQSVSPFFFSWSLNDFLQSSGVPNPAIGHVKGKNSRKLQKMEEDTHTKVTLLPRFVQKNFFRKELFIEMNTADVGVFLVEALAPVGTEGEDDYKVSDINLACKMIAGEVKRWREPPPAPHTKRDKPSGGNKHSNDGDKA